MSRLRRFEEQGDGAATPDLATEDPALIAEALAAIGARFERWPLRSLAPEASDEMILETYAPDIERLRMQGGYRAIDMVRMTPDHPHREALRTKFLDEHRHGEDEVRFFVEGEGLFTLRAEGNIHVLLCAAGDLISVPAGMRHWFDMGPSPRFTAIRLFTNPEGWVAQMTGDAIADRFPRHEPVAA